MKQIHCAICGTNEKQYELFTATFSASKITDKIFSARRTPDHMHHRIVVCLKCTLVFSNPILNPKEIQQFYKGSSFHYSTESEYLKKTYGKYLKEILSDKKGKHTSLLDIGCGNGFFLEEATNQGVKIIAGVEPGVSSVKKAKKAIKENIIVNIFKKGLFKKNSFDIITCFHTLDHIIDPNAFLKETRNVLKKKGNALFIVHNTHGLSVKLLGGKSPIFDIEHIYLFNKKTLRRIFQQNGFRVNRIFDVVNTYPLGYWLRMMPLPGVIKRILSFLFTVTHVENVPISVQAGNIGIIAEKL